MEKNNSFNIGILQGRLSPSLDGRFQFFPKDWEKEFLIAKDMGFTAVEWLFDWPDFENNPIISGEGRKKIKAASQQSALPVSSICADYYMKYRFLGRDSEKSVDILKQLIQAAEIRRLGFFI